MSIADFCLPVCTACFARWFVCMFVHVLSFFVVAVAVAAAVFAVAVSTSVAVAILLLVMLRC